MKIVSPNFAFLAAHDPQLVRLGALAERYFQEDPSTCLIKLRQFGEALAPLIAAKTGLFTSTEEAQADLLRRLSFERVVPREAGNLFHHLRISGNRASHGQAGDHAEALTGLKIARQLGIWLHRTFADAHFAPGPFVPPPDPIAATQALQEEMNRLKRALDETQSNAEKARLAAEAAAQERMSAEERVWKEREERDLWEQLASEAEQARSELAAQLRALQAATAQVPATVAIVAQAENAAAKLDIDEATTRTLIDTQLRARGWEVDSETLRFGVGTSPTKGRNLAIAEWPTKSGPADYALFVGTRCIGVVEAKRRNRNVSAFIDQAQRYARGFLFKNGAGPIGGPWPDSDDKQFFVPFVFSVSVRK